MSRIARLFGSVTAHSRVAIVLMLVVTVGLGAGAPMVEQSSSLDQFQSDTTASEKLDYIQSNFSTGDANTTTAQVVLRDENVLDRGSLVGSLAFQQRLRTNGTIDDTLVEQRPTVGIANVVATAAIRQEQATELQATAARVQELNASVQAERRAIAKRRAALNGTAEELRAALTTLRENESASVDRQFEQVRANSAVELTASDYRTFERAAGQLRDATNRSQARAAYRLGTRGVLAEEYEALRERAEALQADAERLRDLAAELRDQRAALENASAPTLAEQIDQLESMNASEIDETVSTVLGEGDSSGGSSVLALMPTGYQPGATEANATMLVVTQVTDGGGGPQGTASDAIVDAQTAMQELADRAPGGSYVVFGSGVISAEITNSMVDSMLIVGPLAMLFVLLALAVAYRDLLDIVLGLAGIGTVLVWTFGFMGWFDVAFNQLFIAVPVLLIGLSIDYAIHIFMRHREERAARATRGPPDERAGDAREAHAEEDPRTAMTVALGGVGVALVWVTATTVIGFLSNLTSPVPPIREFGVVSSVGIVAALLVFGVLIPALKVELDEFLESRGFDRHKRAFGTGGGRFSSALSVGSTAARKAPYVVIAAALVLSVGGAYGATQVDTSFSQEDFLAEDPPAWMEDLPEPFEPHDYSAKQNLAFVNEHFIRQDSQAQILVQGDVADPGTLDRLAEAQAAALDKNATQTLRGETTTITSPLTVMADVAATNATFNATLADADTDGDGIPDRNVTGVYAALFDVAPDRAGGVVHRTDGGEYVAVRMVVPVEGGASSDAVTEQMRDVAAMVDGEGLTATATGNTILSQVVQKQLLDTVVKSLIITLVAVFAFMMVTYRVTEGSATLGAVTLTPVVLSVAWILGTMYLLSIPFNVMTGMITSLTVGLGVAYSIHLSERYSQELRRHDSMWDALDTTVRGTGGALLGSAATTVGGFGVLVFAILPPLQQFGLITGLTIIYAFLASVLVLPSLLVVWTRYVGTERTGEAVADATTSAQGAEP